MKQKLKCVKHENKRMSTALESQCAENVKVNRLGSHLFMVLFEVIRVTCCVYCTLWLALFPGLPCFSSLVCVQYNTRKRKSAKNMYYTERKPKN